MTRKLIVPAVCGKRLQKIEQDEDGNVYIHTNTMEIFIHGSGGVPCRVLTTDRVARPEPLVVSGTSHK